MTNDDSYPPFGSLLRLYRERSIDGRQGKHLFQERLAHILSERIGLVYNRNNIGGWETGRTLIPIEDRRTLIALILILVEYKGISTQEEVRQLLASGNYRDLNVSEWEDIRRLLRQKGGIVPEVAIEDKVFRSDTSDLDEKDHPDQNSWTGVLGALQGLRTWISNNPTPGSRVELYDPKCGDIPIDLGARRLLVSSSFGAYFAGLLEKPNLYFNLDAQIERPIPRQQEGLPSLQRIFWLLEYARGPRTVILGGEGGMGKSTLSAKIIRCLHQEQAIDLILGDSAKDEYVDPLTKKIIKYEPGYYDPDTLVRTNLSLENAIRMAALAGDIYVEDIKQGVLDTTMAIPTDTTINSVPANVLRPVPDLIRILRNEIFVPGGPLNPPAQGDVVTLMQSDEARIRIINKTYDASLEQCIAVFLTTQGIQVVEFGVQTGLASRSKVIL